MKSLNLIKKAFLLFALVIVNAFISKADVALNSFKIQAAYQVSGQLKVTDANVKTAFKFEVMLSRNLLANGSYEDPTSTVTLVYSNCGVCGTYQEISAPRQITNKDFKQGATDWDSGYAYLQYDKALTAELPAKITTGSLMIKLTYYDSNQKKTLTKYLSNNMIGIFYAPVTVDIFDLITYPARRLSDDVPGNGDQSVNHLLIELNPIGIKLPAEQLNLKWNASKLTSNEVTISLYSSFLDKPAIRMKKTIPNTGSYAVDFSSLDLPFAYIPMYRFYIVIEDVSGHKTGRSGIFHFVNDHAGLFDSSFPNAFPNAFWIFRPDSSGSYSERLTANWLPDRISATNVSIDLYDGSGILVKRLTESTPNNGYFTRPGDNSIPAGNSFFYQFKITSLENPSQVGYSEMFNNWND
ncbi:hypothetical protein AY601_3441 [Pedobacter cryoconitis]|uniref:Uncharacterized protein n=1 Tax=Pedobacter cryoconitis TaxID=188932 RepID=A0A127VG29_9SPHI|nr:hypothetical protein [Pedobacter cryoconitis]AMQ00307.1 hypothetical protein AY601_3441 [Pedobacter cryoconitis]